MTPRKFFIAIGLAAASAVALPTTVAAAPPGYDDPVPRVEDRLCPGVTGLRTDAAQRVVERIRYDADRLGVPLDAPDGCTPNMIIFFVGDAGKTLDSLMQREAYLFDTLSTAERQALKRDHGPTRVWNQIVTRSRDGMKINDPDNLAQVPHTQMWEAHSKIYVPVRRDILTTVVLFDSHAVVGKTLTQLADYAAMHAFANDYSVYPQGERSILKLFDVGDAPAELTPTDLVFLKTLYSGIPNLPGRVEKSTLARAMDAPVSQ